MEEVPEFSAENILTLCAERFIRNYVSRVKKHSLPKKEKSCLREEVSLLEGDYCIKNLLDHPGQG